MTHDPHDILAGRTIWLIGCDGFVSGYLGMALASNGAETIEGEAFDAGFAADHRPAAAVIDLSPGVGAVVQAGEVLAGMGIPFLMIGSPAAEVPALLRHRPFLLQPFASFQVIDALAGLLASAEPVRPALRIHAGRV